MNRISFRKPLVIGVILIIALAGCVVSRSPISGNKRAYGYTWQQEIALGRDTDGQIVSQYGVYDDLRLTAYVDSLGQMLVDVSHLRRAGAEAEWARTEFFFRILDSPVVNAFALPGGYIYVTRGLLAHLENEAQLAVVLGHEIAHVAGRHASKRAAKQMFGQAVLIGGALGGQVLLGGKVGSAILNYGGAATQLLFLKHGRDDERESDHLGVEYSALLGYDAAQAADFFRTLDRLGEQAGNEIPSFLSTHPDPGERVLTMERDAEMWGQRAQTGKVGRENYFSYLDGLVFGENPRTGFARDGQFYHPELAFEFPVSSGFEVINQANRVLLISEDRQAAVILEIASDYNTAREASEAFSRQEGLTVIEAGLGNANALSARYVLADMTTSEGALLRVRAHFVDYDGTVYSFLGFAARVSFKNYDGAFQSSMRGFRRLTDRDILTIQPKRLDIRTARTRTAFESVLPETLPDNISPTMLAIMNQIDLSDTLGPGRTFKLIR